MSEHVIECWQCSLSVTLEVRSDEDGCCPGCGVEIDLEDYLIKAMDEVEQLKAQIADARYRIEQGRVWNGMGWTLTGLSSSGQQKALDALTRPTE